jgi:hypothetical protein
MGLLRRHWLLSAIVGLVLLSSVGPYATDYLDERADRLQNECGKEARSLPPREIPRPAHPGGVLKIRLTNDGALVDRCELSDVLYELNWNTPGAARPPVSLTRGPCRNLSCSTFTDGNTAARMTIMQISQP